MSQLHLCERLLSPCLPRPQLALTAPSAMRSSRRPLAAARGPAVASWGRGDIGIEVGDIFRRCLPLLAAQAPHQGLSGSTFYCRGAALRPHWHAASASAVGAGRPNL